MWRNWLIGILGLWVIALAFFGFPQPAQRALMIITGIAVAFVSFWRGIRESVAKSIEDFDSSVQNKNTETPNDEKIS